MRLLPLIEQKALDEPVLSLLAEYFVEQGQIVASNEQLAKTLQVDANDPTRERFLIEIQGKIVGFSSVCLQEECFPDEDLPEQCLKVVLLHIHPEFRQPSVIHQAFKLIRQYGRDKQAALIEVEACKTLEACSTSLLEEGLELVGKGPRMIWRGFI